MCIEHSGVGVCALHPCVCTRYCPVLIPPLTLPQESCARVLLFRGANKDVRNYNSQTAFQVRECLQECEAAPGHVCPSLCGVASLDLEGNVGGL